MPSKLSQKNSADMRTPKDRVPAMTERNSKASAPLKITGKKKQTTIKKSSRPAVKNLFPI